MNNLKNNIYKLTKKKKEKDKGKEKKNKIYKIGISISTIMKKKKNPKIISEGGLSEILKKNKNFKVITIDFDKNNFEYYKKINFDLIFMFSYFKGKGNKSEYKLNPSSWDIAIKYRYLTTQLNYKNIIYFESPISRDLFPDNKYRLSLNSIYFYKNELPICILCNNKKLIKEKLNYLEKRKFNPKKQKCILILLQNYTQYFFGNMTSNMYVIYINNIIKKIRKYSQNRIIIREKAGKEVTHNLNITDPINNLEFSTNNKFEYDLLRSYKCIAHSTNAVSFAVFYGLDIICLSKYNIAYKYGENDFKNSDKYIGYNYKELKNNILNCAYSENDIKSNIFMKCVNKILCKSK